MASHWVVTLEVILGTKMTTTDSLLMVGAFVLFTGIIIYVGIFYVGPSETADKPEPKWKQSKAFGCLRVIIYIILIFAALMGLMVWRG